MIRKDVAITGLGLVSPLGNRFSQLAENLLAGRSGVRRIERFAVEQQPAQIAGLAADEVPCPAHMNADIFRDLPRLDQAALWSCYSALEESGWWAKRSDIRVGLILGTAAEWFNAWEADGLAGGDSIYQSQMHVESLVHRLQRQLELTGPSVSLSAACASGNYALALGRRWLEMGWVDVCLAGACDMTVTPLTLAGFGNLRALSRKNDRPAEASRPFDCDRDGFVMGEGGAVFVLESLSQARRRGSKCYARVAGWGGSSDAFNMVIPSSDPQPAIAAMRQALLDAQIRPEDIDYINAHATGTPVGDIAESRVLEAVFGEHLSNVPVSSTKSMMGHLLTGAAAVEAAACLVALQHQALPPTINLDKIDPQCSLRHVPHQAQARPVSWTASNSFGFGGSNTCLVLAAA